MASNDPRHLLPPHLRNVPDGRVRLRYALSAPLSDSYKVILIDSQRAKSVMLELIIVASTGEIIGRVQPVLPDIRAFLRGAVTLMEDLRSCSAFGITLPAVCMLINCMKYPDGQ